jgi:hypothetical protein
MSRPKIWKVRVKRAIEEWVDVEANSPLQAELLAANIPFVISVFGGSAMRGDRPIDRAPLVGVEEDEDG